MGEVIVADSRVRASSSVTPGASQTDLAKFGWLLAQLGVLVFLIRQFSIESQSFERLSMLTVAGFAVHYFLPLRYRLPFFVALSLGGIALVLGFIQAAWLVALGVGLIGLAHLPVPFWGRVGALTAAGLGLAALRWGVGSVPWSAAVWPLLGSFFVFRLIVYLYDCRYQAGPTRLSQTLGYFFLLPNVCFPLFPVVDFKRFCRNYYDAERHGIYQVGVDWMLRGVLHLLAYRFVYQFVTLDSAEVADLATLLQYAISTFLLYVRISGQFHLAVGILHLFGFNLPETNHKYFLASSFTDFWRRINIYWKDFMLKVFYYPAYFTLRRLGDIKAIVLATVFTFFVTWFLHAVQWFWIRGGVFIEPNDIIFWSIFGSLVLVNSLYEARRGRSRTLTRRSRTLSDSVGLVLRTLATFTVICMLWSLWTAESVSDWLHLMSRGAVLPEDPSGLLWGVALAVALLTGAVLWLWKQGSAAPMRPRVFSRSAATVLASATVLAMLANPPVASSVGLGSVMASLQSQNLNRRDAGHFQRGYYENLLAIGRFNTELQRVYEAMPADFVRSLSRLGLTRETSDALGYEMLPHKEGVFIGALIRTNRWGMRDEDYSLSSEPAAYRVALLGASHAMGSGVPQDETFEALVERRVNQERHDGTRRRLEFLNFGVAGYSPLQILMQLRLKVPQFHPHAVVVVGHNTDAQSAASYWIRLVQKGALPEDAFLHDLQARSGVTSETGPNEARRRVNRHQYEILSWTYRTMVAACRDQDARPVFLYLPFVGERDEKWRAPDRGRVLDAARLAGFDIIDLTDVYDRQPPASLWLRPGDGHPNAQGSRLIADRLYDALQEYTHEPVGRRPAEALVPQRAMTSRSR